ncbi:hypothetical protein [Micromonospora endolithica]|uniref:Serine/threonine protein kinase n=1 Tax=Micromonospora endolithica TaxID=230091 RepID=A0A3A9ZH57_9ACTN|nr:hypothetical protein [Micromonospora endolithica]RKN47852.1 hypothetical protein D7223_14065 [Micromonospora endolithica]
MKRMTPMLTLLTGSALAAVLFTMSAQAAPPAPQFRAGAPAAPASPDAPSPGAEPDGPAPTGEAADPGAQPGVQPGATPPAPSEPAAPPPSGPPSVDGTWTGRLDGGATIALTVRGDRATAYVCDGRSLEIWVRGTVTGGVLDLSGADGATLTGRIAGDRATGEVTSGGRTWAFTATATGGDAPALYRATAQVRDAGIDGGWILLPDGTQTGVVTWNGRPVSAPPLDPAFGTTIVDGVRITAEPVVPGAGTGG